MKDKREIINLLNNQSHLREFLYAYGFLLCNEEKVHDSGYPFYNMWTVNRINDHYSIYSHPKTQVTIINKEGKSFVLIGHAYNPYTNVYSERDVLNQIIACYNCDSYRDTINSITGLFVYFVVDGESVDFEVDATGLHLACHAVIDTRLVIASHAQIIDDFFNLAESSIVNRLIKYKWYYRMKGTYLPCDLTPFENVKRVIPDIAYSFSKGVTTHSRVFPLSKHEIASSESDYDELIMDGATVLKNSMKLIAQKWEKPFISLTGGIDSNTTFAAANGLYDTFGTFTYVSAPKEEVDAEASARIASTFGVSHTRYNIPNNSSELIDYDSIVLIMKHNSGYVTSRFDNEYRKRVFLINHLADVVDVEVKSWSSEAIRGYFHNHFARKKLPKCTPRVYRNLYKLFFFNRSLAHEIDKHFDSFMKTYEYYKIPESMLYDIFYTEVSMGSWGAQNLSEMRMYSEVTSIFNNRKFLDRMLCAPLDKRIDSQNHLDMKRILNPELYKLNIRVINQNETKLRAKLLNLVFSINNWLPF